MSAASVVPSSPQPDADRPLRLGRIHLRRLREVYRSAGWPCQDLIEVELLAAGLLERRPSATGHEVLRVTDAGLRCIAESLHTHRASRDAHEALVRQVAREMARAGRIVYTGLSLRARVPLQQASQPEVTEASTTAEHIEAPHQLTRTTPMSACLRRPWRPAPARAAGSWPCPMCFRSAAAPSSLVAAGGA